METIPKFPVYLSRIVEMEAAERIAVVDEQMTIGDI